MTRKSSGGMSDPSIIPGPNRTIWEVMLLRPKHQISIAPVKKKKFRENDGESRLFGQHRWSRAYCDPSAVDSADPPRAFHVNAMDLFKNLHEILKTLDDPSGYRFQMDSYLDWSDIHDLQNWNIRERAARRQTRAEAAHLRKMPVCYVPKDTRIMNKRLHKILLYASTSVVFHGNTHDIPIIVHTCVQEILRRGIYEGSLFRQLPEPGRFTALVDIFNDGPSFGDGYSLRQESVHNVAGIFVDFVVKIKDPLISSILLDPLWYWCVKPSVKRDNAARDIQETAEEEARDKILQDERMKDIVPREDFYYVRKPVNWEKEEERKYANVEGKQIDAAVILLKLLPAANLSLLVYLFDCFVRIISSRRNLVEQQDIVRIFAHTVVGGKSKPDAWRVMHWLLDRWPRLLVGLYGESKGITKRPAVRRPSYISDDSHDGKPDTVGNKKAALQQTSTGLSEGDEILLSPSHGLFEYRRTASLSHTSSASCYSNDEGDETLLSTSTFQNEVPKDHRRQRSKHVQKDKSPEPQSDMIAAILTLMREEQARAHRLERKLSAQERKYKVRRASPPSSCDSDNESIVSEERTKPKRDKHETKEKREAKERRKKNKESSNTSGEEDIESMGQKFKAFLHARSDAQTDSG